MQPTNNYPGQSSPDVKGVSKPKSTPPAPKPSASGGSNLLDNIPSSLGSGGNVWGSPMGKQLLPMAGILCVARLFDLCRRMHLSG